MGHRAYFIALSSLRSAGDFFGMRRLLDFHNGTATQLVSV
jgi:hypothetical protein